MEEQVTGLAAPLTESITAVLALIEKATLDPRADAAKLERLIGMYEGLKAKAAELAFNAAKGLILKKLARVKIVKTRPALYEIESGKPQKRTYEAFKYAPLEEIDKHLRPLCSRRIWISPTPTNHGSMGGS
jgi:hypothetical protein